MPLPPRTTGALLSSRRGFLRVSAGTAAVLTTGSALLMGGCDGHDAALIPPGQSPKVFTPREFAVLCVLVSRLLPDEPGWPTVVDTRTALRCDREMQFHHRKLVEDLRLALLVVEHGDLVRGGLTRFTRLSPADQDARLRRMADGLSVEKQAFQGLRFLAFFFHYTDERTWPLIGYAGPLVPVASPPPADNRRA